MLSIKNQLLLENLKYSAEDAERRLTVLERSIEELSLTIKDFTAGMTGKPRRGRPRKNGEDHAGHEAQ